MRQTGLLEEQSGESDQGRERQRNEYADEPADALDALIREVRVKHGIAVSRDDPILMVYTINREVMEASISIQSALLADCRRDWEAAAGRIQDQASARLEQRIREILKASTLQWQEVASQLGREQRMREEEASQQVIVGLRRWQRLASVHLALSCLLLAAAALVLWAA